MKSKNVFDIFLIPSIVGIILSIGAGYLLDFLDIKDERIRYSAVIFVASFTFAIALWQALRLYKKEIKAPFAKFTLLVFVLMVVIFVGSWVKNFHANDLAKRSAQKGISAVETPMAVINSRETPPQIDNTKPKALEISDSSGALNPSTEEFRLYSDDSFTKTWPLGVSISNYEKYYLGQEIGDGDIHNEVKLAEEFQTIRNDTDLVLRDYQEFSEIEGCFLAVLASKIHKRKHGLSIVKIERVAEQGIISIYFMKSGKWVLFRKISKGLDDFVRFNDTREHELYVTDNTSIINIQLWPKDRGLNRQGEIVPFTHRIWGMLYYDLASKDFEHFHFFTKINNCNLRKS
mgnify:FL=1